MKRVPAFRCPKNPAEAKCWDALLAKGWNPCRRGWPDFMAFKDGQLICVEVKPYGGFNLKRTQERCMRSLAVYGIPCYRYSPDTGFQRLYVKVGQKKGT